MRDRRILLLALATVVVLALWWADGGGGAPEPSGGVDPVSGLAWVDPDALPAEARETIALIDKGGPFPEPCCDGTTFQNREGILPDHPRGYYREYTVETPGVSHRGARRIVAGEAGELYWTDDHYQSFERIRTEEDSP